MRIRRRPPLPLSPPFQNPNLSSLQIQEPTNTRRDHHDASGLLHPDGDLTASKPQSDPHPKQVFMEEKYASSSTSSSPYKRTTDAQVHSNERSNVGGKMERDGEDKSIDTVSSHQASASTSGNNDDRVVMNEEEALTAINVKKRRSPAPGVLAEGSRCSRVNGRGWRCNQQTLVGYSLCEHHLGKGRLRSISGVRRGGRKQAPTIGNGRKARKVRDRERVRVVKARSISSLLGEAAAGPSVDAMAAAAEGSKALV